MYSYAGKVLSAIIEHDGNHKLCVEVSKDDAHVFDLNRMHNIKLFQVNARPSETLIQQGLREISRKYTKSAQHSGDKYGAYVLKN